MGQEPMGLTLSSAHQPPEVLPPKALLWSKPVVLYLLGIFESSGDFHRRTPLLRPTSRELDFVGQGKGPDIDILVRAPRRVLVLLNQPELGPSVYTATYGKAI